MATYNPPTENLPIFDPIVFRSRDTALTQAEADLLYLHYPNAQGTENLQAINVAGNIIQSNSEVNSIVQQNITTNGISNTLRQTTIYGDLSLKRPSTTNGGALALWDVASGSSGAFTQFYQSGATMYYYNRVNSGNHRFYNFTNTGAQVNPLTIDYLNLTIATVNPPTCSATQPASTDSSTKIPTTAWVQSAISAGGGGTNKTYTTFYNTNQTVTLPANCNSIDIVLTGAGGIGGNNQDLNAGAYYSGGSGSGGNSVIGNKLTLMTGKQLVLTFNSATGSNSTVTVDSVILCRAFNGNAGGNATTTAGGAGGSVNNTAPTVDTTYTNWISVYGSAGTAGLLNAIPSTAGFPKGRIFSDGGVGCGQRHNQTGANDPPSTAQGLGGCWITFYLT